MDFENVFVTVGTTRFDNLIAAVTDEEILKALKERKCKNLKIQVGNGEFIPQSKHDGINVEFYKYKDSLTEDISQADLIISHAGAGTCLEVLEQSKPLITVINEQLMDNHQTELAEKLSNERYSVCCTCSTLTEAIKNIDVSKLKPFIYDNDKKCAAYIENLFDSNKYS